jgi:hypothetical protein
MDGHGEPSHISPTFFDLLRRQFLPLAGLRLHQHLVSPTFGYELGRKSVASTMRLMAAAFSGESILGDTRIHAVEGAK